MTARVGRGQAICSSVSCVVSSLKAMGLGFSGAWWSQVPRYWRWEALWPGPCTLSHLPSSFGHRKFLRSSGSTGEIPLHDRRNCRLPGTCFPSPTVGIFYISNGGIVSLLVFGEEPRASTVMSHHLGPLVLLC